MSDERKNLWAPWRIGYIQGLDKSDECFICRNLKNPQDDDKNFILWRTKNCIVVLNRFPYNNGHLMIAPNRHIADLEDANSEELTEIAKLMVETKKVLSLAIKPHGFNIGVNLGRCAGAGLPGHVHVHVVPRWDGDTNFMSVCGDTKLISQSLAELYNLLKQASKDNNIPGL